MLSPETPQDKDLGVNGLFKRFSPEISAGKWDKEDKEALRHAFSRKVCPWATGVQSLQRRVCTLLSYPNQGARKQGLLLSSYPSSLMEVSFLEASTSLHFDLTVRASPAYSQSQNKGQVCLR